MQNHVDARALMQCAAIRLITELVVQGASAMPPQEFPLGWQTRCLGPYQDPVSHLIPSLTLFEGLSRCRCPLSLYRLQSSCNADEGEDAGV